MKTKVLIPLVFLMFPLISMGQKEIIDDVYFKAGDVVKTDKSSTTKKPKIDKNGAKEIIFTTNDSSYVASQDTTYLVAEANDSTETDQGYYLNGFNGTESDMEYADRIRKFHDPRFRVFVGDPNYNDIYLLNDWDWNVYLDGSYAYVTPTWTNPYWFDYMYSPYTFGYNGWYWRNSLYNPYYYGSYYSPYYYGYGYGYGNYYGYGWNNPYYGGYYSWWNQPYYGGYSHYSYNRNHDEAVRRSENNSRSLASSGSTRGVGGSTTIAGSRAAGVSSNYRSSYTTLSDNNRVFRNASGTRVINGNTVNSARSSYTSSSTGNGSISRNTANNSTRSINAVSTRSRTTYTQNSDPAYTTNNTYRSANTTSTNNNSRSASYSTPRTSYSTGTPSVRSTSSGSSTTTRSSSYSSPTSTRSSGSYSNSSSSSSSSRSSGSSSSGSAGRSSGGNGGRR